MNGSWNKLIKEAFQNIGHFFGCFWPRPEASGSMMKKVRQASKNRMSELIIKI